MMASPKRFGFPVDARLRRPNEYKRTLSSGKRIHCGLLMAVVSTAPDSSSNQGLDKSTDQSLGQCVGPRLGLAIAKRQTRLAHERNRVKRIAREYFRRHRAQWPPFDCVIMAKSGVEDVSNPELHRMMKQLFDKVAAQCVGS